VRALFFMKHPGSVRNFESVLRELAARGHTIHLAFTSIPPAATAHHLVALAEDLKLTYGLAPSVGKAQFAEIGGALRRSLDYLRYLTPAYASADKLRARAAAAAPGVVVRLASLPGLRTQLGVRVLRAILSSLERAVPPPAAVRDYLAAQAPDLVLVTPLVGIGSAQADLVRAAKAARIPTVFPVHSWDNLTNKGLVRDAPGVRRALLRPLVRVEGDADAGSVLRRHRALARGSVPPLRLLVAVHRSRRGRLRPAVVGRDPGPRRPARGGRRARTSPPPERRAMERRGARRRERLRVAPVRGGSG
jgi:hypothetical protein